jgi:hypothetical protein
MVLNNYFLLYTTQQNVMSKMKENFVKLFCVDVCCALKSRDNTP